MDFSDDINSFELLLDSFHNWSISEKKLIMIVVVVVHKMIATPLSLHGKLRKVFKFANQVRFLYLLCIDIKSNLNVID